MSIFCRSSSSYVIILDALNFNIWTHNRNRNNVCIYVIRIYVHEKVCIFFCTYVGLLIFHLFKYMPVYTYITLYACMYVTYIYKYIRTHLHLYTHLPSLKHTQTNIHYTSFRARALTAVAIPFLYFPTRPKLCRLIEMN